MTVILEKKIKMKKPLKRFCFQKNRVHQILFNNLTDLEEKKLTVILLGNAFIEFIKDTNQLQKIHFDNLK
jgi:hypothetical protein